MTFICPIIRHHDCPIRIIPYFGIRVNRIRIHLFVKVIKIRRIFLSFYNLTIFRIPLDLCQIDCRQNRISRAHAALLQRTGNGHNVPIPYVDQAVGRCSSLRHQRCSGARACSTGKLRNAITRTIATVVRSIIPRIKQFSQCLRKHSLLLCLGQMFQVFRQRDPSRRQIAAFLKCA